ncbi:beta-N-acetylhexosaminidase [Anaerolineales bacterium HSG25]|nr:beta-N-acetylhexosaminidase [Anaerolineales bacterium HSG25]
MSSLNLIPKPQSVTIDEGQFALTDSTFIYVQTEADKTVKKIGHYLADKLKPATGFDLQVVATTDLPTNNHINLIIDEANSSLGEEGYTLQVTSDMVNVTAAQPAGLFRGVQTLRQLFPSQIEQSTVVDLEWTVPAVTIEDSPRFAYRGAMLDPARHFYPVSEVKQYIDLMAYFKLNFLHLHLTDDQGWRIEITSWPKLTEIGGSTAVDGLGGYYTQADYTEIVNYAQEHFITVVPEIDMPGHTNAALASYAKLNCDDTATELYTGIEVGFSSFCIDKEITYQFVDDVIRELAAITPGPYFHIGGDESNKTEEADFITFMGRVLPIVQKYDKTFVAWDETAKAGIDDSTVIQHWKSDSNTQMAIAKGAKVIMSPGNRTYLDMKYYEDSRLGLTWAGLINTEAAYSWDPATVVPDIPEEKILGIEAPLWSETIENIADLQWLAYPRLCGHAELGWSSKNGRGWDEYKHRLSAMKTRLDGMGVNYFDDPVVP